MRHKAKSATEREEHLERIALLDRRGWSQYAIAREVGKSQPSVCYDLQVIRKRYKESMLNARDELIAEKIVQYQDIRKEAWIAYERSMQDADKLVEEFGLVEDKGTMLSSEELVKRIVTREGRLPANSYLQTIMQTLKAERELLGLDEPIETNINAAVMQFPWDALHTRPAKQIDPVQQAIEKQLETKPSVPQTLNDILGGNHSSVAEQPAE